LTSANSPTPYRDQVFGPDFATSVFVSEPAQNVVHREVLEPNGVTFTSHRAADEQDREFLASSDNWFRPTMLKTGPDGALYIADIYRRVIEHPEYFPDELKNRPDLSRDPPPHVGLQPSVDGGLTIEVRYWLDYRKNDPLATQAAIGQQIYRTIHSPDATPKR